MSEFLTFGEIMLRLRAPGFERFFQSPQLEATFGGGEANVAVSLFVSALPDNDIGQNAVNALRGLGVGTDFIKRQGDRIGIYFLYLVLHWRKGAFQPEGNVINLSLNDINMLYHRGSLSFHRVPQSL